MSRIVRISLLLSCIAALSFAGSDARLRNSFREPARSGWIFVHLEGSPAEIGYQHGYLLGPEIEDAKAAIELSTVHEVNHSWKDMRKLSETIFLPRVPDEYRQELTGIEAGLRAHGSHLDLIDLVTMNAFMEMSYYYDAHKNDAKNLTASSVGEHCSAFVATGSYTKDGRIVIGHNNWSDYLSGSRWNIVFDIQPAGGHRFVMDGVPGLIHSGDDFGINDAGIMITETTIGSFHGFDSNGVPEFARARKAMQYAESVDDFARLMEDGNNGGYANLVGWRSQEQRNRASGTGAQKRDPGAQ